MFLKSAIEKILIEKDIRRKENQELKKACETALEELKEGHPEKDGAKGGVVPSTEVTVDVQRFLLPFQLACASRSPKIVIIALDCLQKLVSYGHIHGSDIDRTHPGRTVTDRIVSMICSAFEKDQADESVLLQILKAILAVVLSNDSEVHEKALLDSVRVCFTIFLVTKSPINEATARGSLTQVMNAVFSRMEKAADEKDDDKVVKEVVDSMLTRIVYDHKRTGSETSEGCSSINEDNDVNGDNPSFSNIYQKDAFLVFRALCVLSQKGEGDQNDPKDTHLRSKLFALEMLLLVLQNAGEVFQNSPPLIHLIKRSLCVTLSNNAVSSVVSVFEKTLAIFVELLDKFKQHLKLQIEVFFKEMILTMLDSPSCSFEHKWVLLNTIAKVVSTPQAVVDLFVNYDCDMACHNIFASLVDVVSKTARMPVAEVSPQREKDREMRLLGLSCLVEMVKCQVDWYLLCENADNSLKEGEANDGSFSHLEQQKQLKDKMEQGIYMFGRKPKDGLAYLQEHGFVGKTAVDIADFFLKEERLDKTVIGDYLGDSNEFHKEVMYAYIDNFDFSSLDLVTSLRTFLEKFRLPGEAQKIDRLMEKFASRYCDCNPAQGIFASADTAYVLAYSIILLTTDLHSAQVRNKMTKDQYVSMNRGINNGADLNREYLEAIYDDISRNEIKMKGGATRLLKSQGRKADAKLEMAAMGETARVLMESVSKSHVSFVAASHQQHVIPMFKMCWASALAAFSLGVQQSEQFDEWSVCLRGFGLSIRLASLIGGTTERKAFIQALSRFTLLTQRASMAHMREKNIEAIKLMLIIGDECGNELGDDWLDVLRCVSQLELVSLIGTGLRSSDSSNGQSSAHYVASSTGQDEKSLSSLQTTLNETASQAVVVAVDKIFQNSCRLSMDAIVDFVTALCHVSRDELSLPSGPRMFMLGKIVEVAFYNMARIRLEWSRIWNVVGEHLKTAGCNDNEVVAHFSVDALRQLSIKFIEKGELPNYRFQKDFLRPFEVIMARNGKAATRELVVACTSLMVDGHADRIKSGWMNLFSIWTLAANDTHLEIVEAAFSCVCTVVEGQFKTNFSSLLDAFQEALKCLAEFACNSNHADMNMDAIRLIRLCADCVAANEEVIVEAPWEEKFSVTGEQRVWLRGWFPIFFELSCIINRCKLDIRTRSLTVMFDILKCHGGSLRPDWWKDLFRIIFRIFEHAKLDDSRSDKSEWMVTTCNHAMYSIVDVYSQYFPLIGPSLLPDLYDQFCVCIDQRNEQLARSAVSCLENVVLLNGKDFDDGLWEKTVNVMCHILQSTSKSLADLFPTKMNGHAKEEEKKWKDEETLSSNSKEQVGEAIVLCVVHADIVSAISSVVLGRPSEGNEGLFSHIPPRLLLQLAQSLSQSHALTKILSENDMQRHLEWKAKLFGASKPNVYSQEGRILSTLLSLLFKMLVDERCKEVFPQTSSLLQSTVSSSLLLFPSCLKERKECMSSVVILLLDSCSSIPRELLLQSLGSEFPSSLCELIVSGESPSLRQSLSSLLKLFCSVH